MAGNRAASRTSSAGAQPSREQVVVLAAIAVLAVAIVIVLVGLYVAVYRPPRAHVLTAGPRSYDVDDVKRRAVYVLLYQQAIAPQSQSEIASKTIETLEREEILRQRAPAVVPEVTADHVRDELQKLLVPPLPAATVVVGTATASPTPAATPTATPTVDQAAYTAALQQRLARSGLTKAELDDLVKAGLLEDRLRDKLKSELPKTMPQVQLVTARLASQPLADQVRSIGLRPGVDFSPVAAQNSVSDPKGARAGVPTWVIVDQLDEAARDVVKGLKAGDISPVTKNGNYFEVYKVVDISPARELSESQQEELVTAQELKWFDAEREHVKIERDFTPEKELWITDHALADYRKVTGTPSVR